MLHRGILAVLLVSFAALTTAGPCTPDRNGNIAMDSTGYQRSTVFLTMHNITSGNSGVLQDSYVMLWNDENQTFQQSLTRRQWEADGKSFVRQVYTSYEGGVVTQIYADTEGPFAGQVGCKMAHATYSNVSNLGWCKITGNSGPYSLYSNVLQLSCEVSGVITTVHVREENSKCIIVDAKMSLEFNGVSLTNRQNYGPAQQLLDSFDHSVLQYFADDLDAKSVVKNVTCVVLEKVEIPWPRIVQMPMLDKK